jgi:hypothetical protein
MMSYGYLDVHALKMSNHLAMHAVCPREHIKVHGKLRENEAAKSELVVESKTPRHVAVRLLAAHVRPSQCCLMAK